MTWKQSRSGLAIDLVRPDLSKIDLHVDVAVPLSLINRFDGHASFSEWHGYSVAQHCCLGADAILHETGGDTDAALAFLLHDAHEVFSGDITTPVAEALNRMVVDPLGRLVVDPQGRLVPSNLVRRAIKDMKQRLDAALYARLDLDWPLPPRLAEIVADMDIRMLRAERDQFMAPPPAPWHDAVERAAPIVSLDWRRFQPKRPDEWAAEWLARLAAWHPTQEPALFGDAVTFVGGEGVR
ncbi:hypothetical protein [Kaistia nematophila]|uniref:HD domain-containing protein n=1 Tax=Kaistia nematophila TaxID=2994654 RepID=A0A9X3IND1_9HYPH|nr:hypothetical protein [Kaistia nematophila]MCX5571461.1 hypothetical protein [Kaistia nematophila]